MAKKAAKTSTVIPLRKFTQETARKTNLLNLAQRKVKAQKTLLSPSTGKFTQSIDVTIPGNHTNLLYNLPSKPRQVPCTTLDSKLWTK